VQLGFLTRALTRRLNRRLDYLLLLLGLDACFLSASWAVCRGAILEACERARVSTRQQARTRLRALFFVLRLETNSNTIMATGAEAEGDLLLALEHRFRDMASRRTGMATIEAELYDLAASVGIVRVITVGIELRMTP
jgi:hypothetical protein